MFEPVGHVVLYINAGDAGSTGHALACNECESDPSRSRTRGSRRMRIDAHLKVRYSVLVV